jgi:GTPase
MQSNRTVAIVGRPNVGKSRLFNRLARKRISIVHDQPGVTRDPLAAEVEDYTVIDTGGIGLEGGDTPDLIARAVEHQVSFSIEAASLILFVVDGKTGITSLDEQIAATLRRSGKPVVLVVNKVDTVDKESAVAEFYNLGLGEPYSISAEHGLGEAELRIFVRQRLEELAPLEEEEATPDEDAPRGPLKICFIGRPNVGKSSLGNRLLSAERLIVSDIPGTTRDAIELDFVWKAKRGELWPFRLTDTAGLRHKTKIGSPVEYFSRIRSLDALREAHIVFLVLDAMDGVTQQDKAVAGEAVKEGKPLIIVVNKWDLVLEAFRDGSMAKYESERDYRHEFEDRLRGELFFSPGSPVMFVSALKGTEIEKMLRSARELDSRLDIRLPTGRLNAAIIRLTEIAPPPKIEGTRFRVYYAVQTGNRPLRIRLFCNQARRMSDSYRRYLEGGLVEEFSLQGCPIHFDLTGKERHKDSDKD